MSHVPLPPSSSFCGLAPQAGFPSVAHAGLELLIILTHSSECWSYRLKPSCLAFSFISLSDSQGGDSGGVCVSLVILHHSQGLVSEAQQYRECPASEAASTERAAGSLLLLTLQIRQVTPFPSSG